MNKEQYLKKSLDSGLPTRCPILNYCERHAWTIYFYSDFSDINYNDNYIQALQKENVVPADFQEKRIRIISEPPTWSKGKKSGAFYNMCPEVNLFDSGNGLGFANGLSCTDGVWDIELKQKFTPLESKHYSECLEFSNYLFENKFNGQIKRSKPRKKYCYTYLMVNRENGRYKIGISNSPEFREKTLMSQEPEIETVCARKFLTRKLAKELENKLHNEYSEDRKRGEWFELRESQVSEIVQLLSE